MTTPQAGRRYRRAAAFLIHSQDAGDDLGTDGATAILNEAEAEGPAAVAALLCHVATLAWQMSAQGGPEAAMEYLRRVAAKAAVDEVSAGAGGEQG